MGWNAFKSLQLYSLSWLKAAVTCAWLNELASTVHVSNRYPVFYMLVLLLQKLWHWYVNANWITDSKWPSAFIGLHKSLCNQIFRSVAVFFMSAVLGCIDTWQNLLQGPCQKYSDARLYRVDVCTPSIQGGKQRDMCLCEMYLCNSLDSFRLKKRPTISLSFWVRWGWWLNCDVSWERDNTLPSVDQYLSRRHRADRTGPTTFTGLLYTSPIATALRPGANCHTGQTQTRTHTDTHLSRLPHLSSLSQQLSCH